jgi:hypothetical protein
LDFSSKKEKKIYISKNPPNYLHWNTANYFSKKHSYGSTIACIFNKAGNLERKCKNQLK